MRPEISGLTSEQVRSTMTRVEPQLSYSDLLSQQLQETVFGQEEATKAVGRRLALFDTGLSDPNRPLGSMFFLGPSGVGKTEMARAAQRVMGLKDDRLKIINMAEYQKDHYVSRFVGSPPSYVGYNEEPAIPHKWLHSGRSVIVFDEIDKAHPDIRQALLGVLDKGIMDARDRQAGAQPLHFSQSLIIFTSNIAGPEIHKIVTGRKGIGFSSNELTQDQKARRIATEAQKGLENALSPEFMNRLDDIVVFNEITDPGIYDRMLVKFVVERNEALSYQRGADAPYFAVTKEFKAEILKRTTGKGGRELRRVLEHELFDKAADVFMGIDVKRRPLVANWEDGEVVFYTDRVEEQPVITDVTVAEEVKKKITEPPLQNGTGSDTGGKGDGDEKTKVAGEDEGDGHIPEETDMEDIKKPRNMTFFLPRSPRYDTIDLAITIRDKNGKERLMQMVEELPLLPTHGNR